jgi:hypothetical protein
MLCLAVTEYKPWWDSRGREKTGMGSPDAYFLSAGIGLYLTGIPSRSGSLHVATTRLWHHTTLAEELAVADASEDELYQALDWLLERQPQIEKKLAARHLSEGGRVLYDVSSSGREKRVWASVGSRDRS